MRRRLTLAAVAAALLVSGCSVPKAPELSDALTLPDRFSASGSVAMEPQWWRAFDDAELERLIERALASNLSLQAAWERLEQARAAAVKSGASRYPELSLSGSASTSESRGDTRGSSQSYTATLAAGYELDLWGRVRATAEAAEMDLHASKEQLRTAQITLSAEVASAWYRLRGERLQAALLQSQIALNEKHLELTERKFRSAQAKASDVLQQRQSLESSRSEALQVQKSILLYEHQLSLLLGSVPGELRLDAETTLPAPPALPDTGIPSELLMQRPDVKAAYYDLMASDRRLAAAVADRYPKLSLTASAGSSALKAGDLFDTWILSLAGNLTAPLYDGGLRKAEAERTEAVRNEAFYGYAQTLLEALKEVEDALTEIDHQKRYLESLDKQLLLSQAAVEQLREQYLRGSGSFVSFLNAQLSHENLQRSRVTAERELLESTITLYRALSTGWEPRRTPVTRNAYARN